MSELNSELLEKEVHNSKDNVTSLMKAAFLRQRKARKAGDQKKEIEAEAFASQCGEVLMTMVRGKIRAIDDSKELKNLIEKFKKCNEDIKAAKKEIEDLKNSIQRATKAVKTLEELAKIALMF